MFDRPFSVSISTAPTTLSLPSADSSSGMTAIDDGATNHLTVGGCDLDTQAKVLDLALNTNDKMPICSVSRARIGCDSHLERVATPSFSFGSQGTTDACRRTDTARQRWTVRRGWDTLHFSFRSSPQPFWAHSESTFEQPMSAVSSARFRPRGLLKTMPRSLIALGLVTALLSASPALADCSDRASRLTSLLAAHDFTRAEISLDEPSAVRDCAPLERIGLRRLLGDALIEEADRRNNGREALIEKAASLGASWKAQAALGDLKTRQKDFVAAAGAYQTALNLISSDPEEQIARIPRQTLDLIGRHAEETRHLAASGTRGILVPAAPTRDGGPGGVYNPVRYRGVEVVRVPSPIQFQYNSVEFSDVGKAAAEEFITYAKSVNPKAIFITGHTDRIGGDEFNLELSRKRAIQVATLLKAEGVNATLYTRGKGKTEPRELSDPTVYDQDQIDALNRRVEFELRQ